MGSLRQRLAAVVDARDSTITFLDGHDDALMGMVIDESLEFYNAVYDQERLIKKLMMGGMDLSGALEFFEYNIEGAQFDGSSPIYVETWKA